MGEVLLVAEGLHKRYGAVHAIRDVSLTVRGGEVLGLIGPNGAGKTTLVDLLSRAERPDTGHVALRGRRRRALARTYQSPRIAAHESIEDYILGGRLRALLSRADREAAEAVCHTLGLYRTDRRRADLTLGELRLVELARALAGGPEVLLLDEPGPAAAPVRRAVIEQRRRGNGVLLIDHDIEAVAALADRMILLVDGAIAFEGDPRACLRSPQTRRAYLDAG